MYVTTLTRKRCLMYKDHNMNQITISLDIEVMFPGSQMRNGQLKAGYNLQVASNNQFVLGFDLYPNPTDTRTLPPFINTMLEQFRHLPEKIVGDAGYGSEANYEM